MHTRARWRSGPSTRTRLAIAVMGVLLATSASWANAPGARASEVALDPSLACEISESSSAPCPNGAFPAVGQLPYWPWYRYRAIMRWDLSQIPAGSQLVSATVVTDWEFFTDASGTYVQTYQLTSPFTDAATWIKRDATTNWASPGGSTPPRKQPQDKSRPTAGRTAPPGGRGTSLTSYGAGTRARHPTTA
jgi:hypothetical protein